MTRPTYGSLFSGVGGMDLGFDTHMDCVFQVEWDKNAQSVLRRHWPDVPKWDDVQDVNGAELPPCDVLTFGSPCQDLSVAGKRAGIEGGRSSMFFEATRIIKEMRNATASRPTGPLPRIAVWENVPGALSSNGGEDFAAVLQALADCGAVLQEYAVLDAQHFGVPQRRRRIFLVAIFDSATAERCPEPLLPVAEGRPRDFAKGRKKGQASPGGVASGTSEGGIFRRLGHGHFTTDDVTSTLKACDHKEAKDLTITPVVIDRAAFNQGENAQFDVTIQESETMASLVARGPHAVGQPIIFDGTRHDDFRMDTEIVPTLKQRMGTGGGQVPMVAEPVTIITHDVVGTLQSRSHKGVNHEGARDGQLVIEQEQVPMVFEPGAIGRLNGERHSEDVSHTLRANMGDNLPAVVQPVYGYDEYNDSITPELHHALRAGTRQSVGVVQPVTVFQPGAMVRQGGHVWEDTVPTLRAEAKRGDNEPHISQPVQSHTYAVRRLTPLECERLMGWPDDHTRYTDTGKEQADTHRYRQCGNGVATPVARWIAGHLKDIL